LVAEVLPDEFVDRLLKSFHAFAPREVGGCALNIFVQPGEILTGEFKNVDASPVEPAFWLET
jgi:hypothetical protein